MYVDRIINPKNIYFKTIFLLFLFFGVFGLACPVANWYGAKSSRADSTNVYVAPASTGDGSGTDWNNQAEWSIVVLTRSNIYYLADGTYGNKALDTAISGSAYIFIKKATVSAHGTDTGWNSAYGDGVATFNGVYLNISTDYWDIDGVTGGGPGNWTSGYGIVLTDVACSQSSGVLISTSADHIRIQHIEAYETSLPADPGYCTPVHEGGCGNATHFFDEGDTHGGQDLYFGYLYLHDLIGLPWIFHAGGSGVVMEYVYVDNVGLAGKTAGNTCHTETLVAWGLSNVDFRYNFIASCPSTGGYVNNTGTSSNVSIYGNVFTCSGIPILCENDSVCNNWNVINNTFANFGSYPVGMIQSGGGSLNMYNNILFNGTVASVGEYTWISQAGDTSQCTSGADSTSNVTVRMPSNCDVYGANSTKETSDPFYNSSGIIPENFVLNAPLSGWNGYNVCASLATCDSTHTFNYDMFGTTRGADGVWDRGAIEYNDITPPAAPSGLAVM